MIGVGAILAYAAALWQPQLQLDAPNRSARTSAPQPASFAATPPIITGRNAMQ
jgi:hypothetical protein